MFQIPAKRKRDSPVLFFLSPAEQELLKSKMLEAGIKNKSAYLRKMALERERINNMILDIMGFLIELAIMVFCVQYSETSNGITLMIILSAYSFLYVMFLARNLDF